MNGKARVTEAFQQTEKGIGAEKALRGAAGTVDRPLPDHYATHLGRASTAATAAVFCLYGLDCGLGRGPASAT